MQNLRLSTSGIVLVALGALASCTSASRLRCRHSAEPDCWLPEYIDWHRANRGRPDAKYLIWVCYRDDGLGGPDTARARNAWGDCAGLGDRLRGIEYLTRIAYAAKRVILVWQESPVLLEHFLSPGDIDWRLTPELGINVREEVARSKRHYVMQAPTINDLTEEIVKGTFQQLPDRVVTASCNWIAEAEAGGPVPDLSQHTPLMGQLARALFRLSPGVEAATDAALASVGVKPGQPYVAAHLRLGGQIGEEFAIQRFSLGEPEEVLDLALGCAAGLVEEDKQRLRNAAAAAAVLAPTQAAAALAAATESESHMPHVLLTDNDELRRRVSAGELPPWVSPELHPVHIRLTKIPGSSNSSNKGHLAAAGQARQAAGAAEVGHHDDVTLVKAHVTSLADFGILVRARCVVLSPSGFSLQAQLLGNQACAATIGKDDRSGVVPCPGSVRDWSWWWGRLWCRVVGGGGCAQDPRSRRRSQRLSEHGG